MKKACGKINKRGEDDSAAFLTLFSRRFRTTADICAEKSVVVLNLWEKCCLPFSNTLWAFIPVCEKCALSLNRGMKTADDTDDADFPRIAVSAAFT